MLLTVDDHWIVHFFVELDKLLKALGIKVLEYKII